MRSSAVAALKAAIPYAEAFEAELGALRGTGRERKARCPFHEDTRPSLGVNVERGLYHCFVCGASGDFITLYERLHRVPFRTALEQLGRRYGSARSGAVGARLL